MAYFLAFFELICVIIDLFSAISLTFPLIVGFLYAVFVVTVGLFGLKKPTTGCSTRHIRSVHEYRLLLRNSPLESRAGPNQRLVVAFGIDNAFTTTDTAYHKKFVSKAKDLMRTTNEEWVGLATAASDTIRDALSRLVENEHPAPLSLTKLVQALVFRVVVYKFFPNAESPSGEDVEYITMTINSQWLMSKTQDGQDLVELARSREELIRRLQPFVDVGEGEDGNTGRENPLNIILPAYETLWRVVLRCFLEVRFRASAMDLVRYTRMFNSFFADPNQSTFESPFLDDCISIKNIVDEALRLYPPTRRIYRQIDKGIVAVDVEYVHRETDIWGTDSLEFSPRRWVSEKTTKSAFIPFGMGSFECPAKNSVGPMMIGILVGGLLARVGKGFELVRGKDKGDALGSGPLEGGREAYADLQITRI